MIGFTMTLKHIDQSFNMRLKPSLVKLVFVVFPHLVAAFILLIFMDKAGLTALFLLLSIVIVISSLIYFVRLHLTFDSNKSIISLQKDLKNNWTIKYKNGVKASVSILPSSFVSEILIIMNVVDKSKQQFSVLITLDSIDKDQYRKLKVFMNTHKLDN